MRELPSTWATFRGFEDHEDIYIDLTEIAAVKTDPDSRFGYGYLRLKGNSVWIRVMHPADEIVSLIANL